MNENVEVIRRTIELSRTIHEGLEHLEVQLAELRLEEALILLKDIVSATCTITTSLELIAQEDNQNKQLLTTLGEINSQLNQVISAYQNQELATMQYLINDQIRPLYAQWQEQLQNQYQANVLS